MKITLRIYFKLRKTGQNILIDLARLNVLKPEKNFTKFIILTRSRSGSNLLVSYLDSHPNIYVRGEIFHFIKNRNYSKILKWYFSVMPKKLKASGFKIFYYHPLDKKCPELWSELINDTSIRIIHLHRKNLIKTIISRQIALQTGAWSSEKKEYNKQSEYYINPENIEKELEQTINWRKEFNELFKEHKILEVFYEDITKNSEVELRKIQQFLSVDVKKLSTHLKKQQTKPLKEVVENYDELKSHFKGTKWYNYFS